MLRAKFRVWNLEVFGWLDLKVNEIVKKLNEVDDVMCNSNQEGLSELV